MNAFTPAQPGDTPGQVEPDDSRPKPIDLADPLDEAIAAAWDALMDAVDHGGISWCWECHHDDAAIAAAELTVRAAAPIIAAPIQAERDHLAAVLDRAAKREATRFAHEATVRDRIANYDDPPDVRIDFLIAEATAAADLRARLATAERERDELRTLANAVLATFVHPGHPGRACLQSGWIDVDTVQQWRERAKEANRG